MRKREIVFMLPPGWVDMQHKVNEMMENIAESGRGFTTQNSRNRQSFKDAASSIQKLIESLKGLNPEIKQKPKHPFDTFIDKPRFKKQKIN